MDPDLATAITLFRRAQDCAVNILVNQLKLPRPESALDWISICRSRGLYDSADLYTAVYGYKLLAHGYGIEISIPDGLSIDFDWGANGEPDGFDTWRLWVFHHSNDIAMSFPDYESLDQAVIRAHTDGHLIRPALNDLYYWPADRAQ